MSQPTLDNIEARAMNALTRPEADTLTDATDVMRTLAQAVLELVQYVRTQEGKAPVQE